MNFPFKSNRTNILLMVLTEGSLIEFFFVTGTLAFISFIIALILGASADEMLWN